MRILICEDEQDLNRLLYERLSQEGYHCDRCYNGEEALDYLDAADYDLLILDIMMPILDGYEVLETLRAKKNLVQVLMLTAKDSIQDRVKGLDLGADDYLIKPFSFDELLARIRVLFRKHTDFQSNRYQIADLVLHADTHKVYRQNQEVKLSAKEFSLLEYMMRNQNIVLSREKLEQHISNFDYQAESNVIDVYIRYLRKKIDDPFDQKLIHTIRGVGYVLRIDV